eukprot:220195_1
MFWTPIHMVKMVWNMLFKSKKERLCNGSSHLNISRNNTQQTFHSFESLKKLSSIIGETVFIEHVLDTDTYGKNGLEHALQKQKGKIVQWIISFEHIKKQYATNKDLLFRLLCCVFDMDENMIDRVLSELQIDKSMIQQLVMYRYSGQQFGDDAEEWSEWTLLGFIAYRQTLESVKKMMSIVGEKSFCDGVFLKDGWGQNALQEAMEKKNWSVVKYMLNVASIKTRYTEEELKELYSQMPQGLN